LSDRWTGEAPEPRPSLSSGHIPHSLSLPFPALVSPPSPPEKTWSTYLPPKDLREAILVGIAGKAPGSKLDEQERVIAEKRWSDIKSGKKGVVWSCGSGMTACVGVLAMRIVADAEDAALDNVAIYDEVGRDIVTRTSSGLTC
jgi:thiosulfate/3-mercaptopyruvate sulfurtransferase